MRGTSAPTEEGEGRGHIMAAARLQLLVVVFVVLIGKGNVDLYRAYT